MTWVRFALLLTCAVPLLLAQDAAPDSAGIKDTHPLKITAVVDSFYSVDLDHSGSGVNQFHNFDLNQGMQLNAAEITLERDGPRFGLRLDTGYGEMFRIMNLPDPWGGPNRYVSQAYFTYKPVRDSGLRLDVGKFYTSMGAEGPETYNNFNYSRSLLYVLGEPYYHFGFRALIAVTKSFTFGAQLVNGCNDVRDNNSGKTVVLTSSLSRKRWGWSQTYMVGPEKPGTNAGPRNSYDSVLTLTPANWAAAYVEALWARERGISVNRWSGLAAAVKFSPAKKWSFSPRLERFNDSTGFNTGTPQHLMEATATVEYQAAKVLVARWEFRRDWSDQATFDRGSVPHASKNQTTFLLGLTYIFKIER